MPIQEKNGLISIFFLLLYRIISMHLPHSFWPLGWIFSAVRRYTLIGMGYLEAMANGLPIVAYDWGPIADVVPDNRCGYLAAEYTPAAVAEEIKKLESASCREQMGCAAKEWVLERFSMQSVALKLKDLFWQPEK